MSENVKTTIGSQLASKSKAAALFQLDMGCDCALTLWTNKSDQVVYENTDGHAFSFYLRGGEGVVRQDRDDARGRPGAICILPQGHSSTWLINDPFQFLHVYLSDREIRRQFAQIFDKDSRLLDMREQTFVEVRSLSGIFRQLYDALVNADVMRAEELVTSLIHESFTGDTLGEFSEPRLAGGLTPRNLNRIGDYARAHLGDSLTLKELAGLVSLSEYHFQRNFKAYSGVSPHVWLTRLRMDHAKDMMRAQHTLADIAAACGFSSQSHFTRTFKQYTGHSPGAYVRSIRG